MLQDILNTIPYAYIFTILGLYLFSRWFLQLIWNIVRTFLPQKNLLQRYSNEKVQRWKTWAVVTGGTDGIGLGFCEQLPKLGFNVCIISRNSQKIDRVIKQLQRDNPQCQFKSIVADFKDGNKAGFFNQVTKQLEHLDIGILINNVGTSLMKDIERFSNEQIIDIITINCTSMAVLTARLIPQLSQRKRSAIINLSSFSAEVPVPKISLYSATKSFNTIFSETVALQHPEIDIISLRPLFIESPLSKFKKSLLVPDRKEHARAVFKQLPNRYQTQGCLLHRVASCFVHLVPKWATRLIISIGANKMKNTIKIIRKKISDYLSTSIQINNHLTSLDLQQYIQDFSIFKYFYAISSLLIIKLTILLRICKLKLNKLSFCFLFKEIQYFFVALLLFLLKEIQFLLCQVIIYFVKANDIKITSDSIIILNFVALYLNSFSHFLDLF